jgi:hypothetical protein
MITCAGQAGTVFAGSAGVGELVCLQRQLRGLRRVCKVAVALAVTAGGSNKAAVSLLGAFWYDTSHVHL